MQTRRDAEIVDWVGRLGAAGAEHVMGRFDMGHIWINQFVIVMRKYSAGT